MSREHVWHTRAVTKSKLRGLNPLLNSWVDLLKDSCRSDDYEDNPWWYNERASLSTLAGAAWRKENWQALEEFSTAKRGRPPKSGVSSGRVKRGRCDLYVAHRSTSFGIEAKQAWQSMGSKVRCDHIARALKLAKRDAGNLKASDSDHRLGTVFAALSLPLADFSTKRGRSLRINRKAVFEATLQWLKDADLGKYDAYAFAVTKSCSKFVSGNRIFPGVLLAITKCKTGTRHSRKRRG